MRDARNKRVSLMLLIGLCVATLGTSTESVFAYANDCSAWAGPCSQTCIIYYIRDFIFPETASPSSSQQCQVQRTVMPVISSQGCGEVWAAGFSDCPVQTGWSGTRTSSMCNPM